MLTEPITVTMIVTDALDTLDVPYVIGGSLANALHGVMRATMDADLVVDLRADQIKPLAMPLGDVPKVLPRYLTCPGLRFRVESRLA